MSDSLAARVEGPRMLRSGWERCSRLPGGRLLFSLLIGRFIPYTGSIPARIEELRAGYARISLADSRAVRNHLRCIHAIALANLAELTGNLALVYSMPDDARFIVKRIEMDYLKKARGRLQAICHSPIPTSSAHQTYEIRVEIFNAAQELVCQATLISLVGPRRP